MQCGKNKGSFCTHQQYNGYWLNAWAKRSSGPNKGLWDVSGRRFACFADSRLYCPVLCLKLPFTDFKDRNIEITFPLTSFPEQKDCLFFLFVIKGNIIFSGRRKGIRFSSCFKSIPRFIAEVTGTGCINHMTPAE